MIEEKDFTTQFIKDCLKTESNDFVKIKERLNPVTIQTLKATLDKYYSIAEDLDVLKKFIFYGKLPQGRENFFESLAHEAQYYSETMFNRNETCIRLLHAGLGLVTEPHEFLSQIDNHIFCDEDLDEVNLLEELGDLSGWYTAIALDALNQTSYKPCFDKVIAKLKARYGEKFSESAAIERDLDKERQELEK